MSASLNQCTFVGNLGKDPVLKFIPSGAAVCNFPIAMNEKWKGSDGTWQEKVEWANIVVWGKSAEACAEYLKKGSAVLIQARVQTRSWEDQDGKKRYSTEFVASRVHFIGGKKSAGDGGGQAGYDEGAPGPGESVGGGSDDDIPF